MKTLAVLFVLVVVACPAKADLPPHLKDAIRLLNSGSDDEKLRAVRTIKELGPAGLPAVPALIEAVKEGPSAPRVEVVKLLATFGPAAKEAIPTLVVAIQEPRPDPAVFNEAMNAVAALGEPGNRDVVRACLSYEFHGRAGRKVASTNPEYLGRHAAATTPVLAELLTDPERDNRYRAALSLAVLAAPAAGNKPSALAALPPGVRESTLKSLRVAIDDPDLRTRGCAASALLDLDPTSLKVAAPPLLMLARRRDSHIAECGALVRAGTPAARLLVEHLDEPTPAERHSVLGFLSQFGDSVLPALTDGLRNPNPRVREGVVRALQHNARGAKLRTGLVARLHDPDPGVRLAAAVTLTNIDKSRAEAAVPVLAELAFDRDLARRVEALAALRLLGPLAKPALPDLFRRVRFGDFDTRLCAAEALMEADRSTWRSYVPALVAALKSKESGHRQRALNRLRDTGPDARAALPDMKERLRDDDMTIRVAAAEAVFRVAPEAVADAVTCLIGVLREPQAAGRRNYRHWRAVVRALDKMGPAAREAVPALIELIRADPDAGMAPETAVIAIRLDPENAGEAYDFFRIHLSPGNPDADDHWIYMITQLKGLAKPLVPDLAAALWSKNIGQRDGALEALAAIGPDAREALPALRQLARGSAIAARAAEVIRTIEKK